MAAIEVIATKMYSTFWSESFWFPKNLTWDAMKNVDGPHRHVYYPEFKDLWMPFPMAAVVLLLRTVIERLIFAPIGRHFNLRNGTVIMPENVKSLYKFYKKVKRPNHKHIQSLADDLQWSTRQVERWFRKRRNLDKSSELKKFCESGWRYVFYLSSNLFGMYVLYDETFTYNTELCWRGWPHHNISSEFYWYYMIELGFYWSLMFSLLTDVKRKDFWEMTLHHIVTICLLCFSWTSNFVRVGMLTVCLHDAVDHWLEAAKIFKYIRYQRVCDALFIVFTTIWLLTRLYVFPFWIIRSCWSGYMAITSQIWPAYALYNLFLTCLQLLHIFWTFMILQMAYQAMTKKEVQKDDRSVSEESPLSDDEIEKENGCVDGNLNRKKRQ